MATVCVCSDYFQVNDDGELCLKPGTMGLRETLVFKTPGNYQFKKADYPWLARVRVVCQGAGGGSAGANAIDGQCIARPGGSGGGWSESLISASALGSTESIVVGEGGAGGVTNNPGSDGGSSSFGGLVIALGGRGGTEQQGSGTSLDTVGGVAGPPAGTGQMASGGGASGGAIRLSGSQGLAGSGGESRMGHGGVARATEGGGTAPRGYGAGAGGALSYGATVDGVDGGDGIVIVELYG